MSHPVSSPGAVMRPGGRVEDCCYIMAPSMCSVNQTGWGGQGRHYITAYLRLSGETNREQNNLVGSVHVGTSLR